MPTMRPIFGRILSAVGAVLLVVALFLTWYTYGPPKSDTATGFQTFTNLRVVIIVGAVVLLFSALVEQRARWIMLLRASIGIVLALLVFRRIIFPPSLGSSASTEPGVYLGFIGALLAIGGGLVDIERRVVEVYPQAAFWRPPAGELGSGRRALEPGDDDR